MAERRPISVALLAIVVILACAGGLVAVRLATVPPPYAEIVVAQAPGKGHGYGLRYFVGIDAYFWMYDFVDGRAVGESVTRGPPPGFVSRLLHTTSHGTSGGGRDESDFPGWQEPQGKVIRLEAGQQATLYDGMDEKGRRCRSVIGVSVDPPTPALVH